jgi:CPA2 family monovalent cation:H+ antiporter-2
VSEILPFRDVFNALFFLSVGMLFDAGELAREPALVLGAASGVVLLKGGVLYAVGAAVSRAPRVSMLFTAALFQVGEFSFVLAQQALEAGLLPELDYKRFLAVAILTILASPFVLQLARRRAAGRLDAPSAPGPAAESGGPEVVIAGFGLNGHHLARVLSATGVRFCVIELNPSSVQVARRAGVPIVFGDVNRPDALEHAGVPGARVLVVAISDPAATRRAVALARRMAPKIHILARAKYLADTPELMRLGADQVVPEDLETSVEIFGRVLRQLHVPRGTIAVQQELIRREGYQLLRDALPEDEHLRQVGQILAETAVDTIHVPAGWYAVGRTLAELGVRARTGAWVISVVRRGEAIERPDAAHCVEPGDLLVLLGDHAEIDAARALLEGRVAEG